MISLESANSIPGEIVQLIEPLKSDLLHNKYVDVVAQTPKAQPILTKMTEYLESTGVLGVHYTRAEAEDICSVG